MRGAILAMLPLLLLASCDHWQEWEAPPPTPATTITNNNVAPALPAYINMAPPPPERQAEFIPPPPGNPQKFTWRPGYWRYQNSQFTWQPGSYIERPHRYAIWWPDRWEQRTYGWVFVPGTWY